MTEHRHCPPSELPLARNRFRVRSLLVGLGFLLMGFLVWLSVSGFPWPSTFPKSGEAKPSQTQPAQLVQTDQNPTPAPAPAISGPPPAISADLLKSQLEQVISGIKEANQKKDLPQLLSHYSSNVPQLTQRAQGIAKTWKIYDYPKMEFEIDQIRALGDHKAKARVTWDVEVKNISTGTTKIFSKTYLINFAKESGQWRVNAIEKVE
jgi:hypothetical protein